MAFNILIHNVNSNRLKRSYEEPNMIDTCGKEWIYLHSKIIYSAPQPVFLIQEVSYEWANMLTVNFQNEKYIVHYNIANKTLLAYPDTMIMTQMKSIAVSDFKNDPLFVKMKHELNEHYIPESNTGFFSQLYNYLSYWVNEKKPFDVYTDKSQDNIKKYIAVIEKLSDKICPVVTCFELKNNYYGRSIIFANVLFRGDVVGRYQKYLVWMIRILLYYLNEISQDKGLLVAAFMPNIDVHSDTYQTITQPDTILYVNDVDLCVPEIDRKICKSGICMNDAYVLHNSQHPPCTRNTIIDDVPIREITDYVFINKNIQINDCTLIPDSIETIPNKHIHSDHYPLELTVCNKVI